MKQYRTTQYLYGVKPSQFKDMQYKDALEFKLQSAKALIEMLHIPEFGSRDEERIREVFDAIELTEYLLNELKDHNE